VTGAEVVVDISAFGFRAGSVEGRPISPAVRFPTVPIVFGCGNAGSVFGFS
jgi:hypothetical protein